MADVNGGRIEPSARIRQRAAKDGAVTLAEVEAWIAAWAKRGYPWP